MLFGGIEAFLDLTSLSAGRHHLSVPFKNIKVWHKNYLVRFREISWFGLECVNRFVKVRGQLSSR